MSDYFATRIFNGGYVIRVSLKRVNLKFEFNCWANVDVVSC